MQDQYLGMDRPTSPAMMDWWRDITSNPLWASGQSTNQSQARPSWASTPGNYSYFNPGSANSPLAGSGITGAGATGAPGAGGFPFNLPATKAPNIVSNLPAGIDAAASASMGNSGWSTLGNFLGSPGGGALASTGLGMVSNYLAGKSAAEAARAQMAQQDRQALISSILNQFNSQREIAQRQGEFGAAGSTTIPSRQGWRERQAMLAGILPGLRNANVQMPSFLQSFKPQLSGGLRLPEGGLGQDVLSQFSPNARQSAEADLDRNLMIASQGNYTAPNYANYYGPGYDSSTQALNQFGGTLRSQNQAQIDAQNAWLRDLLNRAIAVNG